MSAPVKNTCPDIDKLIIKIIDIGKTSKEGMKHTDASEDNYQRFKDCEWFIDDIVSGLEDLRKANASLREWGEGLEGELHESAQIISDLENQLEEKVQNHE